MIFSGVAAATASISIPPAIDAIKHNFSAWRSIIKLK
jgi:hypothetical protein